MLAIAVALWVGDTMPKTFADLEVAKVEAVHGIKTFHLEMNATFVSDGKTVTMHVSMLRDGDRQRTKIEMTGIGTGETISDGSTTWTISEQQKAYYEFKPDPKAIFDPSQLVVHCEPHSFNYTFSPDSQFGFACDPSLTLKSIDNIDEGGIKLRRVVASGVGSQGHTLTITQWFLPDRWILKRFSLDGSNQDGPFSAQGEATTLDFKARTTAKDFVLDPEAIKGYAKQEVPAQQGQGAPSIEEYKKSADAGNSTAMVTLGRLYYAGQGVGQDYAEAAKWLRKAAEAGNVDAMVGTGYMYLTGQGVARDDKEAAKWYTKAANAGNASGMAGLGQLYATGRGVSQDYAQAFTWSKKAADAGNSDAMVALGQMYFAGQGVQTNSLEGFTWTPKAAEAGNGSGMDALARLYCAGQGVKQDYAEASKWFREAVDVKCPTAFYGVAYLYLNGLGVDKDPAEGVKWLRKGADAGDPNAMYALGVEYETGQGVDQDREQAVAWYRKAAKAGFQAAKDALERLGEPESL